MLRSRKQLLVESEQELSKIRKKLKNESPWPESYKEEWYDKVKWPINRKYIKSIFERYKITEKDLTNKFIIFRQMEKNGFDVSGIIDQKEQPAFKKALELADILKTDKRYQKKSGKSMNYLYDTLIKYLTKKGKYSTDDYGMDPIMLVRYVIKNGNMPRKLTPTESVKFGFAQIYYLLKYKKNEKKFNWKEFLSVIGRGFLMGF
jgi:hypothetical protein